ncbi:MAG: aminotransferase class IV [Dehalococcoidales bacterium]|nr:aminotransferase class IV [Dehalococcoidales bacterium]
MNEKVYLNGQIVPADKALLSVNDHGFLYGYGLFQTVRAYNGKMFLLDRHIMRLYEAAKVIGLEDKIKDIDLAKACDDTLAANGLKEARIRLTVTNGDGAALPWVDKGGKPTIVVTAVPYTPFPEEKYNTGFHAGIASERRMKQSSFSAMKSINYLLNVVERMEAAAKGLDETIILNDEGYIAEGGGSNVFFVDGGKLVTPSLDNGIIPGVTREVVIELAGKLGISVREGPVGIGIIKRCEEAFMTNAIIEVMPITQVSDNAGNSVTINGGKPGEVTRRLMAAYREMVKKETA